MKTIAYAGMFCIGFAASFGLRAAASSAKIQQYGRDQYRRGVYDGKHEVYREAVRGGHGYWTPGDSPVNQFVWSPRLNHWNPDGTAEQFPE